MLTAGNSKPFLNFKPHGKNNLNFTEEQWSLIQQSNIFSTKIVNIRLFKFITCGYATPLKLNRINPEILPYCWKQCKKLGSYIRCCWECQYIKSFCQDIITQIKLIMGYEISLLPEIILLNIWHDQKYPKKFKRFNFDFIISCQVGDYFQIG